jgi:hypothetical protein
MKNPKKEVKCGLGTTNMSFVAGIKQGTTLE